MSSPSHRDTFWGKQKNDKWSDEVELRCSSLVLRYGKDCDIYGFTLPRNKDATYIYVTSDMRQCELFAFLKRSVDENTTLKDVIEIFDKLNITYVLKGG